MGESWAVEFHDSTIASAVVEGTVWILEASVWLHSSAGRPGSDRGKSWTQHARFRLESGSADRQPGAYPLNVTDGSVQADKDVYDNVVPLPFDRAGTITLRLSGNEGDLVISGRRLTIELVGEPEFIDEFEPGP